MTTDIKLAFAHPLERSEAMSADAVLDRISLRDHIVEVEIGAFQAERDMTQRVSFNIVVEVRQQSELLEDDVDRILSYDVVTEAIAAELNAERLNLLETLAERIADRILLEPQAKRVFVRIEKLDRGSGALGVEIVRTLGDQAQVQDLGCIKPNVVFLSNEALQSPYLTGWIDQLAAQERPLIICLSSATDIAAKAAHAAAQQRIDLLAIEQNAWVLAARDTRCVVVGTKTELDWAMKNGQICVWAPSKIVLDAVDSPLGLAADPAALANWFASQMNAAELLMIGGMMPKNTTNPAREHPVGVAQL